MTSSYSLIVNATSAPAKDPPSWNKEIELSAYTGSGARTNDPRSSRSSQILVSMTRDGRMLGEVRNIGDRLVGGEPTQVVGRKSFTRHKAWFGKGGAVVSMFENDTHTTVDYCSEWTPTKEEPHTWLPVPAQQ